MIQTRRVYVSNLFVYLILYIKVAQSTQFLNLEATAGMTVKDDSNSMSSTLDQFGTPSDIIQTRVHLSEKRERFELTTLHVAEQSDLKTFKQYEQEATVSQSTVDSLPTTVLVKDTTAPFLNNLSPSYSVISAQPVDSSPTGVLSWLSVTSSPESEIVHTSEHSRYFDTVSTPQTPGTIESFSAVITATVSDASDRNDNEEHETVEQSTRLNVVPLHKNAGYVTTPGFGNTDKYPSDVNDTRCFSLNSSNGQTLLLSFPIFALEYSYECKFDYLVLFVRDERGEDKEIWKKCGHPTMIPFEIVSSTAVCLLFVSDYFYERKGFNVTYSILPGLVSDYQLDNGFINCDFIDSYHRSLHFDCNLRPECTDKRDEMNCSYSSEQCPGLIHAGDKCYTTKLGRNITWNYASEECTRQNQTLVSPQTPLEWDTFVNVILNTTSRVNVYIGLQATGGLIVRSPLYKNIWRWSTDTSAFYFNLTTYSMVAFPACALYQPSVSKTEMSITYCSMRYNALVMCQIKETFQHQRSQLPPISRQSSSHDFPFKVVQCPSGHFIHAYLVCDSQSHCYNDQSLEECLKQSGGPTFEQFTCSTSTTLSIHYTLVCDFRPDCPDHSDESFCIHDICHEDKCINGQCVKTEQLCDGIQHCVDGSDENCRHEYGTSVLPSQAPPAIVKFDGKGAYTLTSLNRTSCPDSHFQCQDSYCLPVYLRCNEVYDCTDHEDEHSSDCGTSTCAGYLRCRGSNICVHPEHVCDGVFHCPKHDDEMLCNMTCPQHCKCQGFVFLCKSDFDFESYRALRYLHIDGFNIKNTVDLVKNTYIILLRLSNCRIKTLSTLKLESLRNLQTLDLRDNLLTLIELNAFDYLKNLRSLVLSRNPLSDIVLSSRIDKLINLDLSSTLFHTLRNTTLAAFPIVTHLNLSHSGLSKIMNDLTSASELQYLDLRKTQLTSYPMYMLRHLSKLKYVWANDFRLCCKPALPKRFSLEQCDAPRDNIASCDDLLNSVTYRTFLWTIASFALIGNVGSFLARIFMARESFLSSFGLFVLNLSIADFLMGVYLAMIGTADLMFRGQYWSRSDIWRSSAACKTAGFLSLLSSEVSAFFICLITVDRLLVLRCPFSRYHFGHKSALVACFIVWFAGFLLALVPLMPLTSHWDFYGQTGVCLPLPFTKRESFAGYFYSFGVMIVLNFVLFVLIALGQAVIYWSVRASSKSKLRKNTKSRDAAIARRLITIVLSDFACWFPTGVLGLWAFAGNDVDSDINVTVAIFVMPFNAALNPFLYTLNLVLDKRQKAAEARLMQRFQTEVFMTDIVKAQTYTKDTALEQIGTWLREGLLSPSDLVSRLQQPPQVALNQVD